ncbi:MAG TPA: serine protease [Planctomycetes bacterium]|nr:serine protease [Planctomycetota bacterium]HIN79530.1 serine protease [Planctomycetota bacterium]
MPWSSPLFLLLWCFVTCPALIAEGQGITALVDATFKITNQDSTATCFVVARPVADSAKQELILVTAAHVLEKMSGNECRIVLREKSADGTFDRREVLLAIRSEGEALWVRHPQVDVAALKLELPVDTKIAALDLGHLWPGAAGEGVELKISDEVWIPCYPAQLEANSAGFPVLRRGSVASSPSLAGAGDRTFLVDYRTFGGDSGAPAMAVVRGGRGLPARRGLVIGLVVGQHRETTTTTTPTEERTVHVPLGLGIVVRSEFIRQTIDRIPG